MTTAGPATLLRRPAFRWLVIGGTVSRLGNAVAPIALAFAVLDRTGSATALGLVVGARSLTNVVLVLFGGVLADRLPRRVVMVASSIAAAVTQGAVATAVATGHDALPTLVTLAAVNGAVSAFALPATAALLPETVRASELVPANAINRLGINFASVVGASLGGVLVAVAGSAWGIAVDAGSFAVAAVAFALVRVAPTDLAPAPDPAAPAAPDTSIVRDLREGWTQFRSRQWLWVVVAAFTVMNAGSAGATVVLGPLVADRSFGRAVWGLVLAGETLGYVLGGLIALRLRVRRLLRFGMVCTLVAGLPAFALAAGGPAAVTFAAFFLTGFGFEQFGVAWETSMQSHIPPALLARLYSYDMLGSFLAIPIGQIAAGPAAAAFGLTPTLVGAGVLVTVAALAALGSPQVRRLERPVSTPEPG